jgi:hypothetical protein
MKVYSYDVEVYLYDWTFVAKEYKKDNYIKIHNDIEALRKFLHIDPLLIGFNNKFYDNHILRAILAGYDNKTIKEISNYIVETDNFAWNHYLIQNAPYLRLKSTDLMSDMQMGNSLKSIAGHLGLDIVESSVPFDIDRPLTAEELDEVFRYNTHDVDITEKLAELRSTYLNTKAKLGARIGLPFDKAVYLTNASLVAKYLKAEKKTFTDARDIFYAPTINWSYIPKEVKEFFEQAKDKKITAKDLWKKKLDMKIADMKVRFAWGGVHGDIKNYVEHSDHKRIIVNFDVASLYPSVQIVYDLVSRAANDKKIYAKTKEERLEFKRLKMKAEDLANKLVLNIVFGATLLASNPLYDERNGRSICVNGQLLMTDLFYHYLESLKTAKYINYNTDGLMFSIERHELHKVYKINEEWQKRTGLDLEETKIKSVFQKDVNNYIMIEENGKVKKKGSYVKYGANMAGSFSINNDIIIVKEALVKYFTENIPIEKTIGECNDPFKFQMIAKAGSTYESVYHIIDGIPYEVQKVNRVFATTDKSYGTLLKKHKDKNNLGDKIGGLPENVIIDNKLEISIDKIDKSWYTNNCQEKINDFLGIRRKRGKKK